MKRALVLACLVAFALIAAYAAITAYDYNLKVGRMWETPSVRPYEQPLLVMESGTVPVDGGEARYRAMDPDAIQPPAQWNSAAWVAEGEKAYALFCAQCHGKRYDGNGTVGQSFEPLPADLRSEKVQSLNAGRMFHNISYGIPGGRQPALDTTIPITQRWQLVGFVQSLGKR